MTQLYWRAINLLSLIKYLLIRLVHVAAEYLYPYFLVIGRSQISKEYFISTSQIGIATFRSVKSSAEKLAWMDSSLLPFLHRPIKPFHLVNKFEWILSIRSMWWGLARAFLKNLSSAILSFSWTSENGIGRGFSVVAVVVEIVVVAGAVVVVVAVKNLSYTKTSLSNELDWALTSAIRQLCMIFIVKKIRRKFQILMKNSDNKSLITESDWPLDEAETNNYAAFDMLVYIKHIRFNLNHGGFW